MQTKLNRRERERVKRLWSNEEALRTAIWTSIPPAVADEFDGLVVAAMRSEGKDLEPYGANAYGGEAARRVMEMVGEWISSELDRYRAAVQKMCAELDYCAKRRAKTFEEEGWTVALAVGDALLQIVTHTPIPIAILTVYIIKRGVLDNVCGCR